MGLYASVPVNSQPWTAHYGDRYDPQLVKLSSEWVSVLLAEYYYKRWRNPSLKDLWFICRHPSNTSADALREELFKRLGNTSSHALVLLRPHADSLHFCCCTLFADWFMYYSLNILLSICSITLSMCLCPHSAHSASEMRWLHPGPRWGSLIPSRRIWLEGVISRHRKEGGKRGRREEKGEREGGTDGGTEGGRERWRRGESHALQFC